MLGEKVEELEANIRTEREMFTTEFDKRTTQVKNLENELSQIAHGKYQDDTVKDHDLHLL